MLLSDIIKIGQPLIESDMSPRERIQLLTDFGKEEVKNFYGNIFIVEINDNRTSLQFKQFQDEPNGPVNLEKAQGIPITLPSGGNPLHAQGIYPIPVYPLYDRHINEFSDEKQTRKYVYDRLIRTIPYMDQKEKIDRLTAQVVNVLVNEAVKYVAEDKQLGILVIVDQSLTLYTNQEQENTFFIANSSLTNKPIFICSDKLIDNIIEARFLEATELGSAKNEISTISNEFSDELVSAYNKGWLWLSPTWEMPRSIYWKKDEWIKGIRLNRSEYEAYYYGTQFLKQIQTPLKSTIIKEMFAPIQNVEAKKKMKLDSFETIYGIPYFTPLTKGRPIEIYEKFKVLKEMKEAEDISDNDLHLELLSGIQGKIIPDLTDEYRLTILYYSGTLQRGDIHIRGQIEDVVPSVAYELQRIIKKLIKRPFIQIAEILNIPEDQLQNTRFKVSHLPTLLSNAYGPGYIWSTLQAVFHRKPISLKRVTKQTSRRLNELANKEDYWSMRHELLFYLIFLEFYKEYFSRVLKEKEGIDNMEKWEKLLESYQEGRLKAEDLNTTEKIGFITGCLLRQFERSYRAKTGKGFVDTRVMRFGSKLTPEMIWKNGLLRVQELQKQWELGIKENFHHALALVLQGIISLKDSQALTKEKDEFMTMFWSGYLMFQKTVKEEVENVNL